MKRRLNIAELSVYLKRQHPPGISEEMCRRHLARAGLAIGKDHKVDVAQFVEAWRRHQQEDNRLNSTPEAGDAKRAKVALQAAMLKLNYDKARGLLVEKAAAEREIAEMASAMKADLLAIPGKLAPSLVGLPVADIAEALRAAIEDALRHLSKGGDA